MTSKTSPAIHCGDCRDVLATFEADSLDACVTDPPYDLTSTSRGGSPRKNDPATPYGRTRLGEASGGFMGKTWDGTGVAFQPETWAAVLRVLKPGAHLLAFGGSRTHHRLMCAIEDAGFEIRDTTLALGGEVQMLAWIHGQGFPKSRSVGKAIDKAAGAEREVVGVKPGHEGFAGRGNLSSVQSFTETGGGGFSRPWMQDPEKVEQYHMATAPATDAARQWEGWGTALKPAWEPIIVARKPLTGTVAANVLEYGTGGLNVDGCRIEAADGGSTVSAIRSEAGINKVYGKDMSKPGPVEYRTPANGRWPANVVLSHTPDCGETCAEGCAVRMLDEQSGERPGMPRTTLRKGHVPKGDGFLDSMPQDDATISPGYGDTGGASRFFYVSKASRREREHGLRGSVPCTEPTCRGIDTEAHVNERGQTVKCSRCSHPTVKPVALMRWLVRLVTPPGGTVLDPFMGSGSTKLACDAERFGFVGIDQDEHYCEIARHRKLLPEVEREAAQVGMAL